MSIDKAKENWAFEYDKLTKLEREYLSMFGPCPSMSWLEVYTWKRSEVAVSDPPDIPIGD